MSLPPAGRPKNSFSCHSPLPESSDLRRIDAPSFALSPATANRGETRAPSRSCGNHAASPGLPRGIDQGQESRQNLRSGVPALPSAGKAVGSAASRFFQPLKPYSGRMLVDPRCSEGAGIDRRPRKPEPLVSRAAALAGVIPTGWSSFPQAVAELRPGTNKPVCRIHSGQHEVLPAPADSWESAAPGRLKP